MVNSFPQEMSLQLDTDANTGDCIISAKTTCCKHLCVIRYVYKVLLAARSITEPKSDKLSVEQGQHQAAFTFSFLLALEGACPTLTMQIGAKCVRLALTGDNC